MKKINNFILERLKINKDSKPTIINKIPLEDLEEDKHFICVVINKN